MNARFLAIVMLSLVIGAGLGYSISLPQIKTLQSSVSELEIETSTLTNDYSNLNTTYYELKNNYDSLNTTYYEITSELSKLKADCSYLNESYVELLQQYEDLMFHYNLINGPVSNFTTVQDLNIIITLDRTIYYYKDPISGNVSMSFLNGTAFDGYFRIWVYCIGVGSASFTLQPIIGFAEFYIEPPVFKYGPGLYEIGIDLITTPDGYMIPIYAPERPSVLVETK